MVVQASPLTVTVLGRQKSVAVRGSFILCHCIQTFLLYEGPIGGSEKCQCKRGASYCVTVSKHLYCMKVQLGAQKSVNVRAEFLTVSPESGEPCYELYTSCDFIHSRPEPKKTVDSL